MPEFKSIPIPNHHFGLTRLDPEGCGLEKIKTIITSWNANIRSPNITENPTSSIVEDSRLEATIQNERLQVARGKTQGSGSRRALLIGSQVNDMDSMDEVLRLHGFTTRRIGGANYPATRSGILDAVDELTKGTLADDSVVVYYTGHGMTTERNVDWNAPGDEMPDKFDRWRIQLIVPVDFDDSTEGDFRGITDFELSHKLAKLSEKTDNVTLILDCDQAPNSSQYPRALAHIQSMINSGNFDGELYPVGHPSVVKIVATPATELAIDIPIQSTPESDPVYRSVLNEALVGALQYVVSKRIRMSWARIMLLVKARVRATEPIQHPGIQGPYRRFCFETAEDELELGLPVSENGIGGYVLQGGFLHGVAYKDRYAIMPAEVTTIEPDIQIAEAEVSFVNYKNATLKWEWLGSHSSLPDRGAHAILTHRGLPKSSVIIDASNPLYHKLSDAVKSSIRLRIGDDIATQLACVEQESHHFTLKDAKKHILRKYRTTQSLDQIAGRMIPILEDLDKAKYVLGLKLTPSDVWPLQVVSVEFGTVKGRDRSRNPLRMPEQVKEDELAYLKVKNSGETGVFVSVLDICLHHVTLCESNIDIPGWRTQTVGENVAGELEGFKVTWPPEVPRDQSIMCTVVVVLTDCEIDLTNLETGVSSYRGKRFQKQSGSMVGRIASGHEPGSESNTRIKARHFGIWTCGYKLIPKD